MTSSTYSRKPRIAPEAAACLVHRVVKQHDDFVHAVNYAVMALFHATNFWPDVADAWMKLDPHDMVASDGTVEAEASRRIWLPEDIR